MKKHFQKLALATMTLTLITSCGSDSAESTEQSSSEHADAPIAEVAAEVVYEPFTIDKLKGSWKATDAAGYSKDQIIGKVYSFDDSTATFYASYGEGSMETGLLSIENNEVSFSVSKEDTQFGGTTTMTTKYSGGFVGEELHLKSQSEEITLTRN